MRGTVSKKICNAVRKKNPPPTKHENHGGTTVCTGYRRWVQQSKKQFMLVPRPLRGKLVLAR